jgi:XTP/dITP diphosphohydrolase
MFGEAGLAVEVLGIADLPDPDAVPEVAETGETFAANALLKAHAVAAATGLPAVADDSGLAVDALGGMPGILSARWSGRHGDDVANLQLVLAQLTDVPKERRAARFVCAAALALPDGTERVELGEVHGRLIREPLGSNGFGYDPIFVPEGEQQTFGQLPAAVKDAMSHRSRALTALLPAIRELAV